MADAFSGVLSYAGWYFLPGFATHHIQDLYYRLAYRAGARHPQAGHPLWLKHRRRTHILVLSLYLLYTFLQALYDTKLAGDFFTLLSVSPSSPDREIKAKFRRLAAKFHPDKIPAGQAVDAEAAFVKYKLAADTLSDPTRRFAYERFGPGIVSVQHPGLKNIKDYVFLGLRSLAPEYAKGAAMLVAMNYFFLPKWGSFWRYLAIGVMVFLEFYFLTHTWEPHWTVLVAARTARRLAPDLVPPHLLAFQILTIARRMSISLNIFISQLTPQEAKNGFGHDRQTSAQIQHLQQIALRTDAEAGELLSQSLVPFKGDVEKVEALRTGMKGVMMISAFQNSPEVQEAVKRALQRRRKETQVQVDVENE